MIVEKIKEVLIQKDSENKAAYEENADRYQTELAQLDKRFREVVRQSKRNLLIFGDRFPFLYFAKEYGLEYYAAFPGCAGDTEPSAATMVFLIERQKTRTFRQCLNGVKQCRHCKCGSRSSGTVSENIL